MLLLIDCKHAVAARIALERLYTRFYVGGLFGRAYNGEWISFARGVVNCRTTELDLARRRPLSVVFTRDALHAKRVLAIVFPSVRPSVCLSVTTPYRFKFS